MAGFQRFEEIEGWKVARHLTNEIYTLSRQGEFARDFVLRDQMRGAAISILSNIAEGFERGGNAEFIQFLSIAKGSVGELRAQLYVALDCGYVDASQFDKMQALANEVTGKLGALMAYLHKSGMKGRKFRAP